MNAPVQLLAGSLSDLQSVMKVMESSFDPAFGEAWSAVQCAGLLPMPGVWLVLARAEEQVVGFSLSRVVADEAELLLLAVARDAQRRGVGKMLLDRFLHDSAKRGAVALHLEVRDGNPAVELYKSVGFKEVGRRSEYYTGCDGEIYDSLTLSWTSTV